MHILVGAGLGFVVGVVAVAVIAAARGKRPTLKQLAIGGLAGAVGGAVTAATLGTGGTAAASLTHKVVAFSAGGASGSATDQVSRNLDEGRPLTEDLVESTATGATIGGAIPVAGQVLKPVVTPLLEQAKRLPPWFSGQGPGQAPRPPPTAATEVVDDVAQESAETVTVQGQRGLKQALEGEEVGKVTVTRAKPTETKPAQTKPATSSGYASVHPPPPAWLTSRFQQTIDDVARGNGVKATPEELKAFLTETYEHIREVNALMRGMGVGTRDLPKHAPSERVLAGIHDFGEKVSVRRLEAFIDGLRKNPLTNRDGVPLEVPDWLARLPSQARQAGERHVDVGKLNPNVAAGLSKNGPPDPFAKALHNLSAHHSHAPRGRALVELIADRINAMRQIRVYRDKPLSFDVIRSSVYDDVAAGKLPPEAKDLVERGIRAQRILERSGQVNPYYLKEPQVDVPLGG